MNINDFISDALSGNKISHSIIAIDEDGYNHKIEFYSIDGKKHGEIYTYKGIDINFATFSYENIFRIEIYSNSEDQLIMDTLIKCYNNF